MRAAEKRVGRAAEPQGLGRGGVDQTARLGDIDAERLLRMDMLAGGDRACRPTSTCAVGTVRLRTISTAGSASNASTEQRAQAEFLRPRLRRRRRRASASATMSRIGKRFAAFR